MTPDFQMERHYRDSRLMRIGGGSSEVLRTSIAKDLGL
jgi:alkylation response protein AidB-like acyl-CoA dehydrogenase